MHTYGEKYAQWIDSPLPGTAHEETLGNGTWINVEVRTCPTGGTQMFIGVYPQGNGAPLEECYPALPDKSPADALVLGINRARALATGTAVAGQDSLQGWQG
ncbi:hypothetical protein [Pseudomonas sp. RIT-To-2]|uniref:hypothetical protein n=1 Tax=Pseudomonas sp. RIT-To-2 TaxID=3462541 RepID=UPI002412F404